MEQITGKTIDFHKIDILDKPALQDLFSKVYICFIFKGIYLLIFTEQYIFLLLTWITFLEVSCHNLL